MRGTPDMRWQRRLRVLSWVLGLSLWLSGPGIAERRVSVELEPAPSVGLDELAVLRIKIEGGVTGPQGQPHFELDNFRLISGPAKSTSISFVNGASSSSMTLSWQLQALAVGQAKVHSIAVRLGDQTYRLDDQQVTVIENAPVRQRRRRSDPLDNFFSNDPFFSRRDDSRLQRRQRRREPREPPEIFLRAEVEPARPYAGQQVTYTLYLFTQVDVRSVNPETLPTFEGFWKEDIPQPDQLAPQMVQRDGKQFGRVVLLQRALFPRRAGRHEIEPMVATLAALIPDSGPFGSLVPRAQEIRRSSNRVVIDVQELPPPPPGFQGAVGRLRLNASLEPSNLEVGDATTLTLRLDGSGHLQGIPAPVLPEIPGVRMFPPQQQSSESLSGEVVRGERTWSFVLVPEKPGSWQVPAIEIPYFDPRRQRYDVARSEAMPLEVRGATQHAKDSGQTIDLHPIRTAALPAVGGGNGNGKLSPWLLGLPWVLVLGLWLGRRQGDGHSHGASRRQLLKSIEHAKEEDQPRRVAAILEDAWRHFLEDRWQIPPGTASPQWGPLLSAKGVPQTTADELMQLADDLHYLRYAPKLSTTDGLRSELIERCRRLLKRLR